MVLEYVCSLKAVQKLFEVFFEHKRLKYTLFAPLLSDISEVNKKIK